MEERKRSLVKTEVAWNFWLHR